ncbi:MAG: M20/M25/M40 family metallo-hydrolase [Anaerolineae bacterium]|nr:M20/M25/M40 family metallo-hydrolase [Anaerolineae bacterium]NUQ05189.1 M20/M25/M40 family metallo-hydrolase [Anaerolineae bacterium]
MIANLHQQFNWGDISAYATRTIEQALAIQRIPAPTFLERERAQRVAEQFERVGLRQIDLDDLHNVYGLLPGQTASHSGVLFTAHTDTVFDLNTPLDVRYQGDKIIYAPGIGDNSIAVAALLTVAEFMHEQGIVPPCDIWFVATTREEGLGDLGGMRAAFRRCRHRISAVVNLEGLAFGHIYNAGIAVRRLRIEVTAEGGHSWLHYGQPSAIHSLMQIGARITAITPPQHPRTTYNIGVIEGGRSVNSIASSAVMQLDMRSEESAPLALLEREVREIAAAAARGGVQVAIEVIGDRPAGSISSDHPLVRAALAALAQVKVEGVLESGSTDGNVPLAAGCPAVTVGVTRGGNAHRTDEYIEITPVADGLRQIVLLLMTTAEMVASGGLR